MKSDVNVTFIHPDTLVKLGRLGDQLFVCFSPYPTGTFPKSKAKWIGLCPVNEGVARTLSNYFNQIAEFHRDEKK